MEDGFGFGNGFWNEARFFHHKFGNPVFFGPVLVSVLLVLKGFITDMTSSSFGGKMLGFVVLIGVGLVAEMTATGHANKLSAMNENP